MEIWEGLESEEYTPFSDLLERYYSTSGQNVPFTSIHGLQDSGIRENDRPRYLEFDVDLKQTLVQAARSLGQSSFMSADTFRSFVEMISNSTTLQVGGSVKSLVDAFVYRALAMIDSPPYVTFDAEYRLVGLGIPYDWSKSGVKYIPSSIIDYRIVLSNDSADADKFLEEGVSYPTIAQRGQSVLHLSVLEPTPGGLEIERCIPYVLMKIHAAAKTLQKGVIRGALTDGSKWIFMILNMKPDGVGARYSLNYRLDTENKRMWSYEEGNDIMAGILACWIRRSCAPYSNEDWLKLSYYY